MEKRILCLDVGEKRIGVAVSDALGITAQGLSTLENRGEAKNTAAVLALAEQYGTDRVLCGLPRNMDGSEGFQAAYVRSFAEGLRRAGLLVRFQDERLTSAIAKQVLLEADVSRKKRKGAVDRLAAVQILSTALAAGGWDAARE